MVMRRKNIIAALVLMVFGVWYGLQTSQLPARTLPHAPSPSFFPWLLTGVLLVLAVALLIQGLTEAPQEVSVTTERALLAYPAAGLLLVVLYVAVLPYFGFLLASMPVFAGLMALAGERRPHWVIVPSIGIPLALFLVFRYLLGVMLPRGMLVEW